MKISETGAKELFKETVDLISRVVAEIGVCLLEFFCACEPSTIDLFPKVRRNSFI